jgi:hypothetical protein
MYLMTPQSMIRHIVFLCVLISVTADVLADSPDSLLFDSHEVLELTMPVDFDVLCRPSQDQDCDFTPTVFKFLDSAGNERLIPISIRRRDGWRAHQTNCQVPTLFVRFDAEDTVGTPFEGQTLLALTSHCGKGYLPGNVRSRPMPSEFERYVVNEYLGYRLYNLFNDVSLRVRLVRIRYVDPNEPRRVLTRDAFFSEHFESLAVRFDAEILVSRSFDPADLDQHTADQVALFQYMVGNTDWSILEQENVLLLRFPEGRIVPVIYDLDMSGLVNAHYATPASGLPITTVTQRYFQGICNDETEWDELFAEFRAQEEAVMSLVAEMPGLGRGDRRMTGVFLSSFFDIIDSPETRNRVIIRNCQPLPPAT